MTENPNFKRQVLRTALLTVGLLAALVFGIIVLAGGDWLPGATIVIASGIAVGTQVPIIRRLCSDPAASSPPTRKPTGHPQ